MPLHPAIPSRLSALTQLSNFLPLSGEKYAHERNFDRSLQNHPNVSQLSPYIRHRTLTEDEILQKILKQFPYQTAEKFIQEIFWRTYWKGWLELRPDVWASYRSGVKNELAKVHADDTLRTRWQNACTGKTGIECFDAWIEELMKEGYLHNHTRMWFASIWTFTLGLPWELGADFFMRHLFDGDPASNTLSWKWVAGLQTVGKHYVATASNIHKYTDERFNPIHQLAKNPPPIKGAAPPQRGSIPQGDPLKNNVPSVLLLHEDDLSPGYILDQGLTPKATAFCIRTQWRSPLDVSQNVMRFTAALGMDALERYKDRLGETSTLELDNILDWALDNGARQIVTPFAPVGPNADMIHHLKHKAARKGISVQSIMRSYDTMCWPHATHGFFKFKKHIPEFIKNI